MAGTEPKLTDSPRANGSRVRPAAAAAATAARSNRIGRPSTASTRTTRRGTTGTKTKSSQTKSVTPFRTLATRTATAVLPRANTRAPRPLAPACCRGRAPVAPAERAESSQSPACPVAFVRYAVGRAAARADAESRSRRRRERSSRKSWVITRCGSSTRLCAASEQARSASELSARYSVQACKCSRVGWPEKSRKQRVRAFRAASTAATIKF